MLFHKLKDNDNCLTKDQDDGKKQEKNSELCFAKLSEFVGYESVKNEGVEESWNPLMELEEKDRRKFIDEILLEMSKDEALVLTLYYLEENSIKDISVITSFSEANVKVKLFRARKSFAGLLSTIKSIEFC